jgi:hypothetical protein
MLKISKLFVHHSTWIYLKKIKEDPDYFTHSSTRYIVEPLLYKGKFRLIDSVFVWWFKREMYIKDTSQIIYELFMD